jgi:hypothetical protein
LQRNGRKQENNRKKLNAGDVNMEEMMCWSCKNSRTGNNPKNIEDIDNGCKLPSILRALRLDENRISCPHYLINEKVYNDIPVPGEVQKNMKDSYPDGKCPDCGELIPEDTNDGDKCSNCGHVSCRLEDVERIEERDLKDICRENKVGIQEWECRSLEKNK